MCMSVCLCVCMSVCVCICVAHRCSDAFVVLSNYIRRNAAAVRKLDMHD